ncbi:MAG: hypothetical protein JXB24_07310 [Bacteroidales bacterium]|nr:hypothetical protein [Bacteroidales bacterium]
MPGKRKNIKDNHKEMWIHPTGSYGDILMLSGVLKQCYDTNPKIKYNLVRRSVYSSLLEGHPAIKKTGHPPKNATIITTDYWTKEKLGKGNQRPYQIIARLFGIQTPAEEKLYLPVILDEDSILQKFIPSDGKKTAIIAPSSGSPRKIMKSSIWQDCVEQLKSKGIFVIQVGQKNDTYIKGAYSLLGLTDLRQLISLLNTSDVILSVDNFVMHAAHMIGKPSIVVWGPTNSKIYGYSEQIHIQCSANHCELRNECLEYELEKNFDLPCPLKENHCMNKVPLEMILENVIHICFPQNV